MSFPPPNQPPPQQPPWPPRPYPFAPGPIPPPYSGLAIGALVTGFLCGPLGLILGIIGIHDTKNGSKRGRGMAIAGIALGSISFLAALALIARAVIGENSVAATALQVGDCIAGLPAENGKQVLQVTTISCDEPHRSELFANLDISGSQYPAASDFDAYAQKCVDRLTSDHPTIANDSDLRVFTLHPTQGSWDQGDRTVSCFVVTSDKRAGSVLK